MRRAVNRGAAAVEAQWLARFGRERLNGSAERIVELNGHFWVVPGELSVESCVIV